MDDDMKYNNHSSCIVKQLMAVELIKCSYDIIKQIINPQ